MNATWLLETVGCMVASVAWMLLLVWLVNGGPRVALRRALRRLKRP